MAGQSAYPCGTEQQLAGKYGCEYCRLCYVGYTHWRKEKLAQLVKSNGDVFVSLGVWVQTFEQGWWQFIRGKYGG
jgi:hypothetical protein